MQPLGKNSLAVPKRIYNPKLPHGPTLLLQKKKKSENQNYKYNETVFIKNVHSAQKRETAGSINRYMHIQNIVYPYSGILSVHRNSSVLLHAPTWLYAKGPIFYSFQVGRFPESKYRLPATRKGKHLQNLGGGTLHCEIVNAS